MSPYIFEAILLAALVVFSIFILYKVIRVPKEKRAEPIAGSFAKLSTPGKRLMAVLVGLGTGWLVLRTGYLPGICLSIAFIAFGLFWSRDLVRSGIEATTD
jgi:hypothetical protein